jgi:lysophospholipase L1-like esterase
MTEESEIPLLSVVFPTHNPRVDYVRCLLFLLVSAMAIGLLSTAHGVTSETTGQIPRGAIFVFYGDSLTARGDNDDGWIRTLRRKFAEDLRRPDLRLINAGRGGSGATDLLHLLQADFPDQPFVAVVGIGINDALRDGGNSRASGPHKYGKTLRSIVRRLTRAGAKVLVWSPVAFGENQRGANEKDAVVDAYVSSAAEAAKAEGVSFVDARNAVFAHKAASASSASGQAQLFSDGLHLSAAGNMFLSELIFSEIMKVVGEGPTTVPR